MLLKLTGFKFLIVVIMAIDQLDILSSKICK